MKTTSNLTMPEPCIRNTLGIEKSVDILDGRMRDLCDAIGALESFLEPLLSPESEQESGLGRAPADSQVSERIILNADAAGRYSGRIRTLIDRL